MKRISLLVFFTLIAVSLFAQTANKPAIEPLSGDMLALQTANSLARYGYSVQSASALIGAAEIFAQIQTQPLGVQPQRGQSATATVETPEFTPATLLADARRIAGRDSTMIAWADEVQRSLNTRTRGAVGGPKSAVDIIAGRDSHSYSIIFRGNEAVDILLIGNGTSDLDLYLYDGNGNLVDLDESNSDIARIQGSPTWTGAFTIEVKNWGNRANRYELYTN